MVKMLKPIGNSYGIIIDRAILDLLGIDRDTPLEMTTERGGLFIRPLEKGGDDLDHKSKVRRSTKRMGEIHRESLRKLAE